jgi:hypothetical protein
MLLFGFFSGMLVLLEFTMLAVLYYYAYGAHMITASAAPGAMRAFTREQLATLRLSTSGARGVETVVFNFGTFVRDILSFHDILLDRSLFELRAGDGDRAAGAGAYGNGNGNNSNGAIGGGRRGSGGSSVWGGSSSNGNSNGNATSPGPVGISHNLGFGRSSNGNSSGSNRTGPQYISVRNDESEFLDQEQGGTASFSSPVRSAYAEEAGGGGGGGDGSSSSTSSPYLGSMSDIYDPNHAHSPFRNMGTSNSAMKTPHAPLSPLVQYHDVYAASAGNSSEKVTGGSFSYGYVPPTPATAAAAAATAAGTNSRANKETPATNAHASDEVGDFL